MSRELPHVTVAAVVERAGRFLLVEEHKGGRAVLNQPAGHVEPGEALIAAAVRETLEETGLALTPTALLGVYRWDSPRNGVSYVRFAFIGTVAADSEPRPQDPDIARALWLAPEALRSEPQRQRSPMVLRCIDDYLSGQRFPLALLHELH